eukprot:6537912-Pyramimonas_sp.AAC.1
MPCVVPGTCVLGPDWGRTVGQNVGHNFRIVPGPQMCVSGLDQTIDSRNKSLDIAFGLILGFPYHAPDRVFLRGPCIRPSTRFCAGQYFLYRSLEQSVNQTLDSDLAPDLWPDLRPDVMPSFWPKLRPDLVPDLVPDRGGYHGTE